MCLCYSTTLGLYGYGQINHNKNKTQPQKSEWMFMWSYFETLFQHVVVVVGLYIVMMETTASVEVSRCFPGSRAWDGGALE